MPIRHLRLVMSGGPDVPPAPAAESSGSRMTPLAIAYVSLVCVAGGVVLFRAIGGGAAASAHPIAIPALMLLSLLASLFKVEIPVSANASTLTACHVIDLVALAMYGPDVAVLVAAWGAWTQCTFRSRIRNPPHQVAFSIATLALTMAAAGPVLLWMGGPWTAASMRWDALGAAAAVMFLVNSGLVAGAMALTGSQSLFTVWFDSFFSSWPSYMIGAVMAASIVAGVQGHSFWLLPLMAAALALIHRNHRTVVERINDAMTDPLTGLCNRRFVTAHVERELARARRRQRRVAVAVLDLDGFKRINDVKGHRAGDMALRRVAHALTQVVRSSDVCARYGGDEFMLVMSDCGALDGARRMEEVQLAVAAAAFDAESSFGVPLAISGGVAVFPDDGDSFEVLFAAADRRMYECKQRSPLARTL